MQKVIVTEIGRETTVVNAFGDLDTENPRLLGQGISPTTVLDGDIRIGLAFADLEKKIGPVGLLDEIPFYAISSLPTQVVVQKLNGVNILDGGIVPTSEAILQAGQLIFEEVGDVIVLDVGGVTTNVYSVTSELLAQRTVEEDLGVTIKDSTIVKTIGENKIKQHYGRDWEKLLNSNPETPEEMALSAELAATSISIAIQRHIGRFSNYKRMRGKVRSVEKQNLMHIRWIIGTGVILTQLPNGFEIMRESIKGMDSALFPQESIAMFLDKDCIMTSLGVLAANFRQGAWQLLCESFGVEN